MHLWKTERAPSLPILLRAVCGTCAIVGGCTIAAIVLGHHGWIVGPLYGGSVWGWYFLETRLTALASGTKKSEGNSKEFPTHLRRRQEAFNE